MRHIAEVNFTAKAVEKLAGHGLTTSDVHEILDTAYTETRSRSTGRPIRFGYAVDGTHCGVVFRWTGPDSIDVVTAFPTREPG